MTHFQIAGLVAFLLTLVFLAVAKWGDKTDRDGVILFGLIAAASSAYESIQLFSEDPAMIATHSAHALEPWSLAIIVACAVILIDWWAFGGRRR